MKIANLRKVLVHKARPAPSSRPFKVQPSNAELTEPCTPTFMRRSHNSRSNEKLNEQVVGNLNYQDDDPMEGSS